MSIDWDIGHGADFLPLCAPGLPQGDSRFVIVVHWVNGSGYHASVPKSVGFGNSDIGPFEDRAEARKAGVMKAREEFGPLECLLPDPMLAY